MTIQQVFTCAVASGAGGLFVASFILWLRENGIRPIQEILQRFRKVKLVWQIFLVAFVAQFFVFASTKPPSDDDDSGDSPDDPPASTNVPPVNWPTDGTNAPPVDWPDDGTNAPPLGGLMMSAPRRLAQPPSTSITGFTEGQIAAEAAFVSTGTNEVWDFAPPQGATIVERWKKHGAARQRLPLGCEHPKDGPMMIDTYGRIWTEHRTFALLGVQVGMVPEANWARIGRESLAWWMTTASNTTVVCWQNALLNRDTNTPVSVQAEFFDNGRFIYRYDLSAAGADATNIVARVSTTNGEETVRLDAGVTSVRGWLLGPEDGQTLDKDNDGISTHDEIFIYGTDPELPDSDGDGRSDGEEIWNGDDPLVGDVSDAEILARISCGATNQTVEIVTDELESTKLWDEFAFRANVGTNAIYSRTFAVDRKSGWTSCFLSGRGEAWCEGGEDAIEDWKLYGVALEWSDDTGASGVVTESPRGDSLYLPLGEEATSVTITLRPTAAGGRQASPKPVFLLVYSPRIEFPSGQEVAGSDGNRYSVFTDIDDFAFSVDRSNRPCHALAGEGEATDADFTVPTGTGVYELPLGSTVEPMERPRLMMGPLMAPPNDESNGGKHYLVILDPWVTYGTPHYGCWHDYPYDWGWFGYWCDCTPECGCGVAGIAAVNAYIDWYDDYEAVGIVEVAGQQVWSDTAYHEVWPCDHNVESEERYCPCGCDGDCEYCSCMRSDGPSQGSIRFRIGLGEIAEGETAGFAWFESEGPVRITPQLFQIESRPDADVSVRRYGSRVEVTTGETHGRDLTITSIEDGVTVAVRHHGASEAFQTWEVTNLSNSWGIVRLVKRNANADAIEDWTYSCTWRSGGEWVWDVADNLAHEYASDESGVVVENGTNWVHGVDGRLERLTVTGTNGEEVVIRTFSYDEDGRMTCIDDGTNGCVTIAYDERGNICEMTGPEGTLRAAWDENGVMTNLDTSAWNGEIPDDAVVNRGPRLMAGRPMLAAPNGGGGISALDALMNYLYGEGAPMWMSFSSIDTDDLTPESFESVRNFISSCHWPDDYPISGTKVIATKGGRQFFLGHITIRLDGWITYTGQCNWTFEGTMRALDDTYDFNAANRGQAGETLTKIGRALFGGHGTPFTISFIGTKPLNGSGHCHAK